VVNRRIVGFKNRITSSIAGLLLGLPMNAARADVVAVVSPKSTLTTLSKSQLADIFFGKTHQFPDGTPAVPIDQEEGSPARAEFYAVFTGQSPAQMKAHWSTVVFTGRGKPPRTASGSTEVKKAIAANPCSISYIDRSAVDSTVKVLLQP
jgi:ABC-type phosphate transport system substrate-binding protein